VYKEKQNLVFNQIKHAICAFFTQFPTHKMIVNGICIELHRFKVLVTNMDCTVFCLYHKVGFDIFTKNERIIVLREKQRDIVLTLKTPKT
jgi:hypothetical protein